MTIISFLCVINPTVVSVQLETSSPWLQINYLSSGNDFQHNTITSIKELIDNQDFTDITLVCEDNQQIEAHKIILSSSCPFMRKMLSNNKHSHPLIYMRGIRFKNLTALVDFMYHGETNIYQEDLSDFLALAEELQLKGLTGATSVAQEAQDQNIDMKHQILTNDEIVTPTIDNCPKNEIEEITESAVKSNEQNYQLLSAEQVDNSKTNIYMKILTEKLVIWWRSEILSGLANNVGKLPKQSKHLGYTHWGNTYWLVGTSLLLLW